MRKIWRKIDATLRYARSIMLNGMAHSLDPFRFILITLSGWMNDRQLRLIDYLREENRVLREQLGDKRLRFTDDQRRRLAAKAKSSAGRSCSSWARSSRPKRCWPGTAA